MKKVIVFFILIAFNIIFFNNFKGFAWNEDDFIYVNSNYPFVNPTPINSFWFLDYYDKIQTITTPAQITDTAPIQATWSKLGVSAGGNAYVASDSQGDRDYNLKWCFVCLWQATDYHVAHDEWALHKVFADGSKKIVENSYRAYDQMAFK